MLLRVERKKDDEVILQVLVAPGVSDGDLAVLLEDYAMDLRFDVVNSSEARFADPGRG